MAGKRRQFTREFKLEVIRLIASGERKVEDLAATWAYGFPSFGIGRSRLKGGWETLQRAGEGRYSLRHM
jgi:transposase-like protein